MCAGSDRRAGGARGVHDAAAAGAELLAAALPRPLPQEVAALPPAQPRHQGAHHRGRHPALHGPGEHTMTMVVAGENISDLVPLPPGREAARALAPLRGHHDHAAGWAGGRGQARPPHPPPAGLRSVLLTHAAAQGEGYNEIFLCFQQNIFPGRLPDW